MTADLHAEPPKALSDPEQSAAEPRLLPAFLKVAGRRVVVVGGGAVAASKLVPLLAAGAEVTVVAPRVVPEIAASPVTVLPRPFEPADLDGAWFVVAAATPEVNRQVARAAEVRRVFVNAVDDPASASAYAGGVVRRDGVVIAISTEGSAPALAGLLRQAIDALLPADLAGWVETARGLRPRWKAAGVPLEARRPQLLEALNALYEQRRRDAETRE
ncbi:MAG TPA: bifunctional precorrin-2 dehydrogenase/sirohydrochlorin ferrochelatase [Vicinamibacterales bacterium]|nr:bifunctional precorrin-2 dehydrogenase/sirohydrochlorin ferrochelatase [Vicinamibacterales bacterium]